LRRAGRFDREITIGVPDELGRQRILEKICQKLKIDGQVTFDQLAKLTPGFVGADLNALLGEAGMIAVKRIFSSLSADSMVLDGDPEKQTPLSFSHILESINGTLTEGQMSALSINYQDFVQAVTKVQPSSKREGFATVPGVSWDDIGALESVREELRMAVVEPIKHPEYFKAVGVTSSMGVLLFGPPVVVWLTLGMR
jgi:ribosome biogenesis ATPase